MTLEQYISDNMPEIFEKQKSISNDTINSIFSFDGLEEDDFSEGKYHKVIYDDESNPIKIDDILHMDAREFRKNYPFKSAQAALKQYMKAYKIWSTDEIFKYYYDKIQDTKKRLDRFSTMDSLSLMGVQF